MSDDVNRFNLDLDKDDNKQYFDLIDEQNPIVAEFNRLDKVVQEFPKIKIFPFFQRGLIRDLARQCKEAEEQKEKWAVKAKAFLINPTITSRGDDIRDLRISHHMSILRDRTNDLNSSNQNLYSSYLQIKGAYINQRNLFIALLGLWLSLFGLVISIAQNRLWPIAVSPDPIEEIHQPSLSPVLNDSVAPKELIPILPPIERPDTSQSSILDSSQK